MKDISIIIPAYNAENYLNKCLYSFINQSMENFEMMGLKIVLNQLLKAILTNVLSIIKILIMELDIQGILELIKLQESILCF